MFKIAPLAPTLFLFAALACATGLPVTHEQLAGVSLTFDHFGGVVDPLKQRMGEPGQLPEARESGKNYWLRLTNSSNDVISFRTYSTYVKPPLKWFDLGNGSKVIALEDGMEITLPFGSESQRGEDVPVGGEVFWTSFLPCARVTSRQPNVAVDRTLCRFLLGPPVLYHSACNTASLTLER
jgi:hypothetical protein